MQTEFATMPADDLTVWAIWGNNNGEYGIGGEVEVNVNLPDDEYDVELDDNRIVVIVRDASNPSVKTLQRMATGMGMIVHFELLMAE